MPSSRMLSLIALCIHYSALTIIMHISRTNSHQSYKASSAVVLTEFFKLLLSMCLATIEKFKEIKLREDSKKSHNLNPDLDLANLDEIKVRSKKLDHDEGFKDDIDVISLKVKRKSENQEEALSSGSNSNSSSSSNSITKTHHRDPSNSTKLPIKPSPTKNYSSSSSNHPNLMIEIVNQLKVEIFQPGWWKLSVPAIMFVVQNNLQYVAASNLSVPLFQITYQLKILTTALCSVLLLNRTLYKSQWIALLLLSIGVAAVQLHAQAEDHPPVSSTTESDKPHSPKHMNQLLGLISVLLACLSSGFASVYFERVLKSTTPTSTSTNTYHPVNSSEPSTVIQPRLTSTSVWIRNIQLSFFGLLMGGLIVKIENQKATWQTKWDESLWWWESLEETTSLMEEKPKIIHDFLSGFNWIVWLVIGFQVLGGLLNALVIKFSDNIAKGFATSVSILISFGLSLILFEFKLSLGSLIGVGLVIFATWFFNLSQDQLDQWIRRFDLSKQINRIITTNKK